MMNQDFSHKLSFVERALWEGVRQDSDNQVFIEPGWVQQITPHAPTAFLNGVYRCELEENAAEIRVRSVVEQFRARRLPFRWKTGPSSRPENLHSLLLAQDLELKDTLWGLYAAAGALKIPANPAVSVQELTLENLEDWLTVQSSAWKVPPGGIGHLRQKNTEELRTGKPLYQNYVAYYGGRPVASAGLRFFSDYAFLMGAAVNENLRRQGIYRTLLAHRLDVIGKRGLPAVIHCLEKTSAPICLKLGFEKICEIHSFEPKTI